MKRFYTTEIANGTAMLRDEERDHCVRVLRTRIGERVEVVNGKGRLWIGELSHTDKRTAEILLTNECEISEQSSIILPDIAIAIPKNPSRWDVFLEKAVRQKNDDKHYAKMSLKQDHPFYNTFCLYMTLSGPYFPTDYLIAAITDVVM